MALAESSTRSAAGAAMGEWLQRIHPAWALVALILVIMPAIANGFVLVQIFGWSFMLGTIALSLMFLAGYGGMVSLAQMTIAGFAGYMVAIFGVSGLATLSIGWPWWLATPMALVLAMISGAIIGALAVRTEGIYTIMITLAIAAAFFYFTNENYALFNGHTGINSVPTPQFLGVDWKDAIPFYYLTLGVAVLCCWAVAYVGRAPFGLALQGIRDNPRRMAALGFNVYAHRVAAYVFAGLIAGLGGVLLVWSNGEIAPGTVSVSAAIDILVIAVVGGIANPIGPFIGALIYAVLKTFAQDFLVSVGLDGNRFRLLIGLGFLAIVFFSPDGVLGLWARWRNRMLTGAARRQREGGGHG
ncbi:branched-chain amino acid ABC transporter permease [Roseiarcus sp.]|uniref:branched-chain amino acid ABC transporter permease n=1 Tax=Roseiarcus sp. TaxID=1969460 RepID=UPI003BB17B90